MKKRVLAAAMCLALVLCLLPPRQVSAAPAQSISVKEALADHPGFSSTGYLYDGNLTKSKASDGSGSLTFAHEAGIGSIYLIFQFTYGSYTITDLDTGKVYQAGQKGFLHEFVDLEYLFGKAPSAITVSFGRGKVELCEIQLFGSGVVPDTVQRWELPADNRTDLLLFSTHGDDEQLFFAGIIPYYAGALGYNVQVVYLTDHRNKTNTRMHEMLNGLWAVGCRSYPVFGTYEDFMYETIDETYLKFHYQGVSRNDLIEFCTLQLRRFKPKVIVTHDFAGEYKHGQHMVYADCIAAALEISADPQQLPHLAEEYGTWDVPKAYFHLYKENAIVMDWDTPMAELDGLSPFQVTQQKGFPCHKTQQSTWFYDWIYGKDGVKITKASQINRYSPCRFGLYRSTVGLDVQKNDFFENVTTYAQDFLVNPPPETTPAPLPTAPETTAPEETPAATPVPGETPPTSPAATTPEADDSPAAPEEKGPLLPWLAGLCVLIFALLYLLRLRAKAARKKRRRRRR